MRAVGVFLILPLAFEYLRQRTAEGKRTGPGLLAAGLPGLGLLATLAHNWLVLGERRSLLEAGSPWGQRLAPIWDTLGASWAYIVRWGDIVEALNLGSLLGFGLLAFFAVRQLPLAYALYVWPYLGLLFNHQVHLSPLASAARHTLVLFPCFIVLALWLARRPWLAATWLVLSALLETLVLIHWVHWGWVA